MSIVKQLLIVKLYTELKMINKKVKSSWNYG